MQEEEKSAEIAVDLQQEAKKIVMNKLEELGVISKMKAEIKAKVLSILEQQKDGMKQQLEFDYMTSLFRQNKPKEIVLVCQLVKEFLKFYDMEYTLPIFENESNIKETVKPDTLLKELNLQEDPKDLKEPKEPKEPRPVLLQLLLKYQEQKKILDRIEETNPDLISGRGPISFASRTDDDIRKGSSYIDISNLNPVKPKTILAPIGFNKSVEMNQEVDSSDKFNNLIISSVYKKDKDIDKEKKEVTANDILNKGKDSNVDPVLGNTTNTDKKNDLIVGNYQTNVESNDDEFAEATLQDNTPS